MSWTKQTLRPVSPRATSNRVSLETQCRMIELDALALEVEEEGPSYLADLNKAPDFIDEPPVEVTDVRVSIISIFVFTDVLADSG